MKNASNVFIDYRFLYKHGLSEKFLIFLGSAMLLVFLKYRK